MREPGTWPEWCSTLRTRLRSWLTVGQETGLHVTHAQADAWLAQLAAGVDQEPPECHN